MRFFSLFAIFVCVYIFKTSPHFDWRLLETGNILCVFISICGVRDIREEKKSSALTIIKITIDSPEIVKFFH